MSDAKELVKKIKEDLEPLDKKILHHPSINALKQGNLSQNELKAFAGQQYQSGHLGVLRLVGFF